MKKIKYSIEKRENEWVLFKTSQTERGISMGKVFWAKTKHECEAEKEKKMRNECRNIAKE